MKYYSSKSREDGISNIAGWENKVFTPGTKKAKDWKKGRSAERLADFMLHRDGEEIIKNEVEKLLKKEVQFCCAIPELEVKFDNYTETGRVHDLGIYGQLKTRHNKKIFIGVEAKVDEPFGDKISEVYLGAKTKQLKGINTNAPEPTEKLIRQNFTNIAPQIFDLKYQFLYSTVGTAAVGADISILLIIVFNTGENNSNYVKANDEDYQNFIKLSKAEPFGENAHKMIIELEDKSGKTLSKELYLLKIEIENPV